MDSTDIVYVDGQIQYGRGRAAEKLGELFNVYRLRPNTNVSMLTTKVFSGYQARIYKASKMAIENSSFQLQVFEFTSDILRLKIGDLLVGYGYRSDKSQFIFAQARPTRENIFVRTELNCTITRPHPHGGAAEDQPARGARWNPEYGGGDKQSELILTLTNGEYNFLSSGTYASVPVGLQPQTRGRGSGGKPQFPTQVEEQRFIAYIPTLPGEMVVENDIINTSLPTADRYRVQLVYPSSVGFSGNICMVEKMSV